MCHSVPPGGTRPSAGGDSGPCNLRTDSSKPRVADCSCQGPSGLQACIWAVIAQALNLGAADAPPCVVKTGKCQGTSKCSGGNGIKVKIRFGTKNLEIHAWIFHNMHFLRTLEEHSHFYHFCNFIMPLNTEVSFQNSSSGQYYSLNLPFLLFYSKKTGNGWLPNRSPTELSKAWNLSLCRKLLDHTAALY